jgi:hypothetical protein
MAAKRNPATEAVHQVLDINGEEHYAQYEQRTVPDPNTGQPVRQKVLTIQSWRGTPAQRTDVKDEKALERLHQRHPELKDLYDPFAEDEG